MITSRNAAIPNNLLTKEVRAYEKKVIAREDRMQLCMSEVMNLRDQLKQLEFA